VSSPPSPSAGSIAQQTARYVLIAVLVLLGGWMLRHFLPALCWAVVLAIATSSVYERWLSYFHGKRRNLCAALTFTTLVGIVLIVPLVYGGIVAVREAISLVRTYAESEKGAPALPEWVTQFPWLGEWIRGVWTEYLGPGKGTTTGTLVHARPVVFEWTRVLGLQVVKRISTLAFTLLTLFFVYLNQEDLAGSVRRVSRRLFGPTLEPLLNHIVEAIRATVDGVVLVAVAEGAIMGGVYAVAGAPHPVLFGAVTGIFAMIPFAAPLVFGAVAVILATQGSVAAAVSVAVIGTILLFVADHFVRPVIIGEGARLPFLWVLLGILGGIESFGLVGIFLGPALMAALCSVWRDWSAATRSHGATD
jgi:predicted PurR-regulated permease PerM